MNSQRALRLGCALFGALIACGPRAEAPPPEAEEKTAPHRDEPEHAEFPTHVRLSDAVLTAAHVQTLRVEREVLVSTIDLPGELSADPDRSARVASPIAGRIEQVSFREGQRVHKGDALLTIRVPELGKVRSELAATRAQAKAARISADRLRVLKDQQLASEQAYLTAEADAQALEVAAIAAEERVQALGMGNGKGAPSTLILRAPLTGVVLSRAAVVGQPLTSEQVVAEIADLSELWFLGRVFEKDLGLLRLGAPAEVLLNAYPGSAFAGVVEYLGHQVDPIARTLTARIRLTNHDDLLRIGLFGSARVSTEPVLGKDAQPPTLVVPRGALTELAGKQVVFVRQADRDFELHEVTTGRAAGGKVEVLSGLREGEQVVSEGTFTLKSSVLKATLAEDE